MGFLLGNKPTSHCCSWCQRPFDKNAFCLMGVGNFISCTVDDFGKINQFVCLNPSWCISCSNFVLDKYTNEHHLDGYGIIGQTDSSMMQLLYDLRMNADNNDKFKSVFYDAVEKAKACVGHDGGNA